jgi:hypothetical protein
MIQPEYVPAWVREGRRPTFIDEGAPMWVLSPPHYFWGNMPALDMLKMKDNEGLQGLDRNFSLLCGASGDCRNVIKTIVDLPSDYTGQLKMVLNDYDFAIVARNVIILLSALHFEPEASASIMIHIWYSALIPAIMLKTLQKEILPSIEDVCAKIKDKLACSIQAKTFKLPHGSLRLLLKKEQWSQLASFFQVPEGLTCQSATALRVQTTLDANKRDFLDIYMFAWPPGQRVGRWNFRKEGILLPFGCSTKEFDTPNPYVLVNFPRVAHRADS